MNKKTTNKVLILLSIIISLAIFTECRIKDEKQTKSVSKQKTEVKETRNREQQRKALEAKLETITSTLDTLPDHQKEIDSILSDTYERLLDSLALKPYYQISTYYDTNAIKKLTKYILSFDTNNISTSVKKALNRFEQSVPSLFDLSFFCDVLDMTKFHDMCTTEYRTEWDSTSNDSILLCDLIYTKLEAQEAYEQQKSTIESFIGSDGQVSECILADVPPITAKHYESMKQAQNTFDKTVSEANAIDSALYVFTR